MQSPSLSSLYESPSGKLQVCPHKRSLSSSGQATSAKGLHAPSASILSAEARLAARVATKVVTVLLYILR